MKTLGRFFLQIMVLCTANSSAFAGRVNIVPEPFHVTEKTGSFYFSAFTKIICLGSDPGMLKIVASFTEQFAIASGIKLQVTHEMGLSDTVNVILLELKDDAGIKNSEGYILDISQKQVRITAPALAGLFYAFESVKQLLPPQLYAPKKYTSKWSIPCVYVLDYPQFPYRGMLLDVSRHFFSASFIKHYLDILSHYKINTFHWHFTDSHGWRLQIKQYPKLTAVGAWRADRSGVPMTIAQATQPNEPATYGGFYTQEEVKEIIRYAKERFITVIPEIEMPGHCTAALVAYPEFSDLNNTTPLLMPTGYPGDLKHNFCVGYDSTYIFLQNVLKEVMELFPSEFINIGGDEVRGEPWLNCPRCQKLMTDKNFTTAKQLQAYFTKRIDSFITAHHRRIIGWEEILGANVSPTSTALSWHGYEGGIDAAKKRYNVVMTPYRYTYFDFYQSDPRLEKSITYFHLFLDTVYAFSPLPDGLNESDTKYIAGGQACLWTENVETPARVEYMTLPRLLALAEVLWTPPANKNYRKFIDKVEEEFRRLHVQGVNYATSLYNVSILPQFNHQNNTFTVTLKDQAAGKYPIHYTTNGTAPTFNSPVYHSPLTVNKSVHLKAALIDPKKRVLGRINGDVFTLHEASGSSINILPGTTNAEARKAYNRLVDGIYGTVEPYDGRWMSFRDSSVSIIIDLQKQKTIRSISLSCMEDQVGNIFLPRRITFLTSGDGVTYTLKGGLNNKQIPRQLLRHTAKYTKRLVPQRVRYVKIVLQNACLFRDDPEKNLILLDEIVIQ